MMTQMNSRNLDSKMGHSEQMAVQKKVFYFFHQIS